MAFVVFLMLFSAFAVIGTVADDSEASSGSWKYTVTINDDGSITATYSIDGSTPTEATAVDGINGSEGSWGFDRETGYGPFGSFYAAFDPSGRMVCHLDPYNLKEALGGGESVDIGGTTVRISDCNIMWCLPKHHVSVEEGSGMLVISSDGPEDTVAESFVIGGRTYNYLAIGVYEATYDQTSGKLGSMSGKTPQAGKTLEQFRRAANGNDVDGGIALLWNYHMLQTYRQCAYAVMGGLDSQGIIGCGDTPGGGPVETGLKDGYGPYYGTAAGDAVQIGVRCFIDDAWGSLWDYVDDAWWVAGGLKVGQNAVPSDGDTSDKELIDLCTKSGWGTKPSTGLDSWGLPKDVVDGHNPDTAPDYYIGNQSGTALFVGQPSDGGDAFTGLSYFSYVAGGAGARADIGARLAFLFDNDLVSTTVAYDHSALRALLAEFGYSEGLMEVLPSEATGETGYDQLEDVAEFRHVGWIVDGVQYPADHEFVKTEDHTAESVWVGLPAVTYDHSRLIEATGDSGSVAGLDNGLEIKGRYNYVQLPSRDGFAHVGWAIDGVVVGPTDPFVTRQSHTAVSLWSAIPVVILDHHELTDMVGGGAEGVSALPSSLIIDDNAGYVQLPDIAGYRHIGWRIGDTTVGPTAEFLSANTHTATSLWEKIPEDDGFVPTPDDGRWDDAPYIPEQKESGWGWLGDSKNILVIAILVTIIAELAVLQISRKR